MDKVARLKKEIEHLEQQLENCFHTRLTTDDPERKVNLEIKEEQLDREIETKKRELAELEKTSSNNNQATLLFGQNLCKLDFRQARSRFEAIANQLAEQEGGLALLMMENCLEREGRLLLDSIRDTLRPKTTELQEFPIEFIPIMPVTRVTFLKVFSEHLGLEFNLDDQADTEENLKSLVREIITKLSGLLKSGTTILIPLTNWHAVSTDYQATFMGWLIKQFWPELIGAVNKARQDYSPRLFFIIMNDYGMADNCGHSEYLSDGDKVTDRQLMPLPLTLWSQEDVKQWLSTYSSRLTKTQSNNLVNYIFGGVQEELPIKIKAALERAYSQSPF